MPVNARFSPARRCGERTTESQVVNVNISVDFPPGSPMTMLWEIVVDCVKFNTILAAELYRLAKGISSLRVIAPDSP